MGSSMDGVLDDSPAVSNDAVSDHDIDDTNEDEDAVVNFSHSPHTLSSPFQEGEKVLAYHNQIIYDAKVLRVDPEINGWRYSVHYLGWSKQATLKSDWQKSWDEWVGIDRLMKHTEENLQKKQEHNRKQKMQNNANTRSKAKSSTGEKGKRRKAASVQEETTMPSIDKRVNIHIPPALRKQLTDDWERVTHLGKLVKLPCSPNVDEILSKYHDYRLKKDAKLSDSVGEIVNGLRCYFDKALPAMLLYKNERQQYEETISKNMVPSAVYGAEHLLRLFVKLPEILHKADIEEKLLNELQQNLVDFVKFLQKNQRSFFLAAQRSAEKPDSSEKREDRV